MLKHTEVHHRHHGDPCQHDSPINVKMIGIVCSHVGCHSWEKSLCCCCRFHCKKKDTTEVLEPSACLWFNFWLYNPRCFFCFWFTPDFDASISSSNSSSATISGPGSSVPYLTLVSRVPLPVRVIFVNGESCGRAGSSVASPNLERQTGELPATKVIPIGDRQVSYL